MGIKGLYPLLADNAPAAIKSMEMKSLFGRKIAIDASMSIYQFLIAVRSNGEVLTNESGETTSHLMGLFYRTLRMIDNGIKPMYVFDGKPPTLKGGELAKRTARRNEALAGHEEAKEVGTAEEVEKFARRQVKVTPEHNAECKKLLKLMGVPYLEAPTEAESQCAELARKGKVYGAASEDMDTLCFNTPVLVRHLTFSEARNQKEPVQEINLEKALEGLDMTLEQFVDLCMLLGCDYLDNIPKIGPKTALEIIRQHKSIEKFIEWNEKAKKYEIPEDFPYAQARELFLNPDVQKGDEIDIKWEAPDVEGLVKFLAVEKGFSEDRVRSGAARLTKGMKSQQQGRLESFFKAVPKTEEEKKALKRKNEEKVAEKNKKKKEEAKAKKAKSKTARGGV